MKAIQKVLYFFVSIFILFSTIALATPTPAENPLEENEEDTEHEDLIGQIESTDDLGPLQCMQVRELDAQKIKGLLERDFNVFVDKDSEEAFDKWFLFYLYAYLKVMNPTLEGNHYIHKTTENGPELVRKEGHHLYFTENAEKELITTNFSQALENFQSAQVRGEETPSRELKLSFKNTLFEQLNMKLMTREQLASYIERNYGISLTAQEDDREHDYTDFSHREANLVLKQLSDLPKAVVKRLGLKNFVRLQHGQKLKSHKNPDSFVLAQYEPSQEKITMTDLAFADSAEQRTLFHEMGHALWKNLDNQEKEAFLNLSWEKKGDNYTKKAGSDFVSEYASTDSEEDFAEHFAEFVFNSKKLERDTPEKFDYFKKIFFPRTVYTEVAANNAKTLIPSTCSDITPPTIKGEHGKFLKVALAMVNEETNTAEFEVMLSGILDNVSGVKYICLTLTDDAAQTSSPFSFALTEEDCIDAATGTYKKNCSIDLNGIFPGDYSASSMYARDKAGNARYRSLARDENLSFHLPGKKKLQEESVGKKVRWTAYESVAQEGTATLHRLKSRENQEKIRINEQSGAFGRQYFSMKIPIEDYDRLGRIALTWYHEESENYNFHYIRKSDLTLYEDPKTKQKYAYFNIHFPSEFLREVVSLSNIGLQYNETEEYQTQRLDIGIEKNLPNTRIQLETGLPGSVPQIRANEIKVEQDVRDETKKKMIIKVPVTHIEEENGASVYVRVRGPGGKEMGGRSARPLETNGKTRIYQVEIEIPQFSEGGEYQVEEVEVDESFESRDGSRSDNEGIGVHYPTLKNRANLLERQIERAIEVKPLEIN